MRLLRERIISKITNYGKENECWIWSGSKDKQGYGKVWVGRTCKLAHRVVYELETGSIDDNLFLCHKCDNPSCCNPFHMFECTGKENSDDMFLKNRQPRKRAKQKIDWDTAKKVGILAASGKSASEISSEIGISYFIAYSIVTGRRWSWITGIEKH